MKTLYLNFLSLFNVGMGFLFIILIGRTFGLSEQSDAYFVTLTLVAYLQIIVSTAYASMKHFYAEFKVSNDISLDHTLSLLNNNLLIISILLIGGYFFFVRDLGVINSVTQSIFDIMIFLIFIRSSISFQKKILNLEHIYWSVYAADAFVVTINIVLLLLVNPDDIVFVAYTTLFSSSVLLIFLFYGVRRVTGFQYHPVFFDSKLNKLIFTSSLKLNASALIYSAKDLVIVKALGEAPEGTYSVFSIANKFIGAVTAVVINPVENIYTAKISEIIALKRYKDAGGLVYKTMSRSSVILLLACLITYGLMPFVVPIAFGESISPSDMSTLLLIFFLLSVYHICRAIELPIKKVLNLFKFYDFGILINCIYIFVVGLGFYWASEDPTLFWLVFIFMILGQLVKLGMSIIRYVASMSIKINGVDKLREN